MIQLKRPWDPPEPNGGYHVLVDRLWPRGISREDLVIDRWIKEVAPSDELRRWFGHDPEKCEEFHRRYKRELDAHEDALALLRKKSGEGTLTLIFAARDREHNNAMVLREYLVGKNS